MGKKKSVVLMTLLTIVIVVLCAITVFPSISVLPGSVKGWKPAIMQYDLGKELGGGYYVYLYPEGVIPESEFEDNLALLDEADKQEYKDSYLGVPEKNPSLYLDKDSAKNIVTEDGKVEPEFAEAVAAAADEVASRFEKAGYSDYRVAVADKYALRVELPLSDANVAKALSLFSMTGEMTIEKSGEVIAELQGKDDDITDLVKDFTVTTRTGVAYIEMSFTKEGKAMLKSNKDSLAISTDTATDTPVTLDIKVGENTILQIYQDFITDSNLARIPVDYAENKAYVKIVDVLLESVLENGDYEVSFSSFSESDIRKFDPVYGEDVLIAMYIALAVVIAAVCVYSFVKMGRFGIVNVYSVLSYVIIVGLCYGFISGGIFEITLGSILTFVAGMMVITALSAYVYRAVKAEFDLGKTVESSVKNAYKKTLGGTIDVYAVALLASLALLIGAAGLYTMALQALICVVSAAFCSLLWSRGINYVFLSASKNKYKYFRFVREDDDDE